MNELIAILCVTFLAGGGIIFMFGRKKWKES